MDRATVYTGANPRSEDFLRAQQRTMVAIGGLAAATLGTSIVADGFALAPTNPTSPNVVLGAGTVYQTENLEASPWSILPTDPHIIVKQGILLDPYTLTFTPPSTVGTSQSFLIQIQYQDVDDTGVVLQYYNSLNPQVPLFGPAGSGTQQNTRRAGAVAVQIKAGVAATSGSQTIPTPDAGWAGLYVVTLAYGQTAVGYGNFSVYSGAPLVSTKLPGIPGAVQNRQWTFAVDSGAQNAVAISPTPAITAYARGQSFEVLMAYAPTGAVTLNVNGLGQKPIVKSGATVLTGGEWAGGDIVRVTYDGANFQISTPGSTSGGTTAACALLTQNLTMTVPSASYPTIRAAVLAAGQYFISPNVYITIAVTAGYIEYLTNATGPIYLSHPHGQRIKIIGAALNGAFPTATDISGKTNAQTLTLLQSRFQVQVQAVGTNAWELHSGYWNQIANILTSSDGTNSGGKYGALLGNWSTEVGLGSIGMLNCWFHNCGLDGVRVEQSTALQCNNVGSTFCGRAGFWISHYSVLECNVGNILAMYNLYGVSVQNDAGVYIDSASGTMDIRYNTSHGIYLIAFGKFNALPATNLGITNNGGWGVYSFAQSLSNLPSQVSFSANTMGNLYAGLVSINTALGASVGTVSPSGSGSVGNNGAYNFY
jgi:hypothetical protein